MQHLLASGAKQADQRDEVLVLARIVAHGRADTFTIDTDPFAFIDVDIVAAPSMKSFLDRGKISRHDEGPNTHVRGYFFVLEAKFGY